MVEAFDGIGGINRSTNVRGKIENGTNPFPMGAPEFDDRGKSNIPLLRKGIESQFGGGLKLA